MLYTLEQIKRSFVNTMYVGFASIEGPEGQPEAQLTPEQLGEADKKTMDALAQVIDWVRNLDDGDQKLSLEEVEGDKQIAYEKVMQRIWYSPEEIKQSKSLKEIYNKLKKYQGEMEQVLYLTRNNKEELKYELQPKPFVPDEPKPFVPDELQNDAIASMSPDMSEVPVATGDGTMTIETEEGTYDGVESTDEPVSVEPETDVQEGEKKVDTQTETTDIPKEVTQDAGENTQESDDINNLGLSKKFQNAIAGKTLPELETLLSKVKVEGADFDAIFEDLWYRRAILTLDEHENQSFTSQLEALINEKKKIKTGAEALTMDFGNIDKFNTFIREKQPTGKQLEGLLQVLENGDMGEQRRALSELGYDQADTIKIFGFSLWLDWTEREQIRDSIKALLQNQEAVSNKTSLKDKLQYVFDFDGDTNIESGVNYFIKEIDAVGLWKDKTLLNDFLSKIWYPQDADAFIQEVDTNYYKAKVELKEHLWKKYAPDELKDKPVGTMIVYTETGYKKFFYTDKPQDLLKLEWVMETITTKEKKEFVSILQEVSKEVFDDGVTMDAQTRTKEWAEDFMISTWHSTDVRYNGLLKVLGQIEGGKAKVAEFKKIIENSETPDLMKELFVSSWSQESRISKDYQNAKAKWAKAKVKLEHKKGPYGQSRNEVYEGMLWNPGLTETRERILTEGVKETTYYGYAIDIKSTLNVGKTKRVQEKEVLKGNIDVEADKNGEAIIVPLTSDQQAKVYEKIKNQLPEGVENSDIRLKLAKCPYGGDDLIIVEFLKTSNYDKIGQEKVEGEVPVYSMGYKEYTRSESKDNDPRNLGGGYGTDMKESKGEVNKDHNAPTGDTKNF